MKKLFEDNEEEGIPTWEESISNTIFGLTLTAALFAVMAEIRKTEKSIEASLLLVNEQFDALARQNADLVEHIDKNRYETLARLRQHSEIELENEREALLRVSETWLQHRSAMN